MVAIAVIAGARWKEEPQRSATIVAAMGIWILLRLGALVPSALQTSLGVREMTAIYTYWGVVRSVGYCVGLVLLGVALFRRKEPDLT